jgi:hypothetical protein
MAFGIPPDDSLVQIRPGLWMAPRWFGAEPKPMLAIVLVELFGFMMHTKLSIACASIIVVVWLFILRLQFERDPYGFEIRRRNVWYLGLRRMRGVALASSKVEPFVSVNR